MNNERRDRKRIPVRVIAVVMEAAAIFITAVVILVGSMNKIPPLFGVRPYIVMSGSMEPAIPTGSVVFIDEMLRVVEPGEVIAYRLNTRGEERIMVTHRVIDRIEGAYITKGDANDAEDENPVLQSQVAGKYAGHIPVLGYLLAAMTPVRRFALILWLVSLNVLSSVLMIAAKPQREENK